MTRRWSLTGVVVLLSTSVAFGLSAWTARDAGWQPLQTLWGRGDKQAAVSTMHRLSLLADAVLHHRKIDAPTQAFIDGVLADLTDFDLGKLHQRLPQEKDGYRELWVRGELQGNTYVVRQGGPNYAVTLAGPRHELGSAAGVVRAKRLWTVNDRSAYSFGGKAGVGIGNVRWDTAVAAAEEAARIVSTLSPTPAAAPTMASAEARKLAHAAHPVLAEEDLDLVSLAFEAYPALAAFASQFATLEDARTVWSDRGYQQLSISVRGTPKNYAKAYPLVAAYAGTVADIAKGRARWVDKQGRTLAAATVDTKELTASIHCYLKNGRLLPYRGKEVFEDDPVDPLSDDLSRSKVVGGGSFKMFGVTIKLSDVEVEATYTPHGSYAEGSLSFTKVPRVEVSGAALGFIPTEFLDAFIPGTIAGLTRDFLAAAAQAHRGQGATAQGMAGILKSGSQRGAAEAQGEAVVLDNTLIRMAVAMVNERLMPTPALIAEAERIADDTHAAFKRDLAAYEAKLTR